MVIRWRDRCRRAGGHGRRSELCAPNGRSRLLRWSCPSGEGDLPVLVGLELVAGVVGQRVVTRAQHDPVGDTGGAAPGPRGPVVDVAHAGWPVAAEGCA